MKFNSGVIRLIEPCISSSDGGSAEKRLGTPLSQEAEELNKSLPLLMQVLRAAFRCIDDITSW